MAWQVKHIFKKSAVALGGIATATYLIGTPFAARDLRRAWSEKEKTIYARPTLAPAPRVAAVLTGGKGRVKEALDMVYKGSLDKLLISGVSSPLDKILESAEFDPQNFDARDSLFLGTAGNTKENAAEIMAWAKEHNLKEILIMTSDYHFKRVKKEMEKACAGSDIIMNYCIVGEDHLGFPQLFYFGNAKAILKEAGANILGDIKTRLPQEP